MREKYDVIIIGAGIGGLICGCYLVKAGLGVLIIEQHHTPGGYCSSFQRNGYRFDVGVHYLGGINRGLLGKILDELGLKNEIDFSQFDPTDKIILPEDKIYIRANPEDTIKEFTDSFPSEKENIKNFFSFIMQSNFLNIYSKAKKATFKQVLDEFFSNYRLKAVFNILLGSIGLPASQITALTAILLFREFILDPGYYPKGGMQDFVNIIATKFKKYGGKLVLSKRVKRIFTYDNHVKGVLLDDGKTINSDIVVSNIDATNCFKELLDIKHAKESKIVEALEPSNSAFALFLGIKNNLKNMIKEFCGIWYSATYDIEEYFSAIKRDVMFGDLPFLMVAFPSIHDKILWNNNKSSLAVFINAPYQSKEFWQRWRSRLARRMINKIKEFMPKLEEYIDLVITATPLTFERYTLNREGAIYGWAPTIKQSHPYLLPQETSIKGLVLAGHWCITGLGDGGIGGVASLGRNAARIISNNYNTKWPYPLFLL